jgi:hypothetical protein
MRVSALVVALSLLSSALAVATPSRFARANDPSQYNDPNNGTPVKEFTGDQSLPDASLAAAALKGTKKLQSFGLGGGDTKKVPIYGDWAELKGVRDLSLWCYF